MLPDPGAERVPELTVIVRVISIAQVTQRGRVPKLRTPMSPGGSQASAGEGFSPCNIGIGIELGRHLVVAPLKTWHGIRSHACCSLCVMTPADM